MLARAALVAWALRAQAALVAVVARAVLASMRAHSATAPLVGMREQVALVERAALQAPLDQMPRRSSAALVALAVTPGLLVLVRRVRLEQLAHRAAALAALVARAAPVERVVIAALAASEDRAAVVPASAEVLVWRAPAALAASAASVEPAGMQVGSAMVLLAGMPVLVAPVALAALRAPLA